MARAETKKRKQREGEISYLWDKDQVKMERKQKKEKKKKIEKRKWWNNWLIMMSGKHWRLHNKVIESRSHHARPCLLPKKQPFCGPRKRLWGTEHTEKRKRESRVVESGVDDGGKVRDLIPLLLKLNESSQNTFFIKVFKIPKILLGKLRIWFL